MPQPPTTPLKLMMQRFTKLKRLARHKRFEIRRAEEIDNAQAVWSALLPQIQRLKRFVVPFFDDEVEPPTTDALKEALLARKGVDRIVLALDVDWSVDTWRELATSAPSVWLICRLADRIEMSEEFVQGLIWPRKHGT
ncbi:hypothetical protein JYT28_00735 [Desulfobulbus sp. AH-315-M07]|nr:hypothetical protein [Desulfobulbus sp. AH-315-M07]